MNLTPVSFGKKIPISQCCIKDNSTQSFIPATFVELEGDLSDLRAVSEAKGIWEYKYPIIHCMYDKISKSAKLPRKSNVSFYALVKGAGDIVGLMQVEKIINALNIDLIEAERSNKYKYVGKNMIAGLGNVLKRMPEYKIEVALPLDNALPFYKSCGFKNTNNKFPLVIDEKEIKNLQNQLEQTTQSPFIDLLG